MFISLMKVETKNNIFLQEILNNTLFISSFIFSFKILEMFKKNKISKKNNKINIIQSYDIVYNFS